MKIAIDIRAATALEKTGVPNYTESLVRHLSKIDHENEYFLFSFFWSAYRIRLENTLIPTSRNFHFVSKRIPGRVMKVLWNDLDLPVEWFLGDIDLIHSLENVIPPVRAARVVSTIYDMSAVLYPQWHLRKTVEAQHQLLSKVAGNANRIIAISECTKRDIVNNLGVAIDDVTTVHPGVSEGYKPVSNILKLHSVLDKYGIRESYILSVGTIEPRKNIKRLIDAFELLKKERATRYQLVIVGKKGWMCEDIFKKMNSSPFSNDIIYTSYLPNEDLPYLYGGAELFCYPSLYEGFGLPPLEAMACGTPVVTSNVSSLPEVVGDAGILVDPESSREIADAMIALIENRELRYQMSERALSRAKLFSWEKAAKKTLEIYKSVNIKHTYMSRPVKSSDTFSSIKVAFA